MIEWSEHLRGRAFSERGAVNPSYLPSIVQHLGHRLKYPLEVQNAFEFASTSDAARYLAWVKKGRDSSPAKLHKVIDAVIAQSGQKKPPKGRLDVDVEAAKVALEMTDAWSAAPYWIVKEGPLFALRALVRAHSFESSHFEHGYGSKLWITEGWAYAGELDAAHAWHLLRAVLATTGDREYAEARQLAGEMRGNVPLCVRAFLAFAFPTEHGWADTDGEEVIAKKGVWDGNSTMLLTVVGREVAERLAPLCGDYALDDEQLATLLARHADDAASVIDALIRSGARSPTRTSYARALACIVSEDAARRLAALLTDKAVTPVATKYFKAHPDLAKAGLGAVASGTGKTAAAASLALESAAPAAKPAKTGDTPPPGTPEILVSPPWTKARPQPIVIEGLETLPYEPRIEWSPGKLEAHRAELDEWERNRARKGGIAEASTDEKLVAWIKRSNGMPLFWVAHVHSTPMAVKLFEEMPVRSWWSGAERALPAMLAQHGLALLPGLLRFASHRPVESMIALARIDSPLVAPLIADVRTRLKTVRAAADRWLLEHVEAAVVGLAPLALGKPGPARTAAESALLLLRESDKRAQMLDVASRYGARVREAIVALDPLATLPSKMPKLPAFASARALPPLTLRSGGVLHEEGVTHFLTMLAFYEPSSPYPGLTMACEALDRRSLRDFTWKLFERWLASGASPKEAWALTALPLAGDDEIVARLVPLIRAWPKEKAIARAALGLEVLGRIATDLALMHIDALARGFRYASIREKATAMIAAAAEQRGLSPDELADRVVPHLTIDVDGKLKKDEKAIVSRQVERLERAMCDERTWSPAEFDALIRTHPLVGQLARKLVWRAGDASFRVTEDGSLATVDDAPFTVAEGPRVSIAHRLAMTDDEVTRWSRAFADYRIIQPFEQLGRAVFGDRASFGEGVTLDVGRVRALVQRGWGTDGESWVSTLAKTMGKLEAVITLDPGYPIDGIDVPQKIVSVDLRDAGKVVGWDALSPVAYSELRRQITAS